ncbi:hypothetical protein KDW_55990 [Dictyobacter vulcani]|uniref:IstB-like ATP-binding domain-containing protein n=1 Tax=Dictyobacter vulcani TaxID=2607529 RepID=A0A5J4KXZ7_9CHLR|nr:hypothetical protein KDW_55990 [Dictyobacter vulcani]
MWSFSALRERQDTFEPGSGQSALAEGHSVLFTTLAELAQSLECLASCLMRQRLRRYIAPSLLIIDEVGYTRLTLNRLITSLSWWQPAMSTAPLS